MVYLAAPVLEFSKMRHRRLHGAFESNHLSQGIQTVANALRKLGGLFGSLRRKFNPPCHDSQVTIYWLPVNAASMGAPVVREVLP
jgi:hypothetical protein